MHRGIDAISSIIIIIIVVVVVVVVVIIIIIIIRLNATSDPKSSHPTSVLFACGLSLPSRPLRSDVAISLTSSNSFIFYCISIGGEIWGGSLT